MVQICIHDIQYITWKNYLLDSLLIVVFPFLPERRGGGGEAQLVSCKNRQFLYSKGRFTQIIKKTQPPSYLKWDQAMQIIFVLFVQALQYPFWDSLLHAKTIEVKGLNLWCVQAPQIIFGFVQNLGD